MPKENKLFKHNPGRGGGALSRVAQYARLLDSQFKIPGTPFSFGVDPILGLIPVLGDAIAMLFQLILVVQLLRYGTSGKLRALLFINVILDTAIGSIPVVGQIFDFFFKSNERNLRLVKEYLYEGKHRGSGGALWLLFFLILIAALALIVWVVIKLFKWLLALF